MDLTALAGCAGAGTGPTDISVPRKHILVLSWYYLPYTGGAELFVKAVTDRLAERFEFTILTARFSRALPKIEKHGNVTIRRTGLGIGFDKVLYPVFAFFVAIRLMSQVDIVHAIMVNATTLVSRALSWIRPRPSLLTLQIGDDENYVRDYLGFWYPLYPPLHRGFTRVHAISNFLRDQAIERGVSKDTIIVIPNGVDLASFSPRPPSDALVERHTLSGKRVIVSVSRLVAKNGLDTLIAALPMVLKKTPNAIVLLVGDGEQRGDLTRQAEMLGVAECVRFVGSVPHEQTPGYLALGDVFVRPSVSEGLGTAFLEAMACGTPVIGTPVGGIRDFLTNEHTGLLCPPGDPQSLADSITRLFTDDGLAARLSKKGRTLAENEYSWEQVAEGIGELYGELV